MDSQTEAQVTLPDAAAPDRQPDHPGDDLAESRADRLADRALLALAALHLLFFAAFAVTLFNAGKALSEPVVACTGENLVDRLRREDPARLAEAMAEAEAIANGHSVFWKVGKPGTPPSWLLGTMHSADPRVTAMPPAAQAAFKAADTVLIESTDILDAEKMQANVLALKDYTLLGDGQTLDEIVPAGSVDPLRAALEARAMPWVLARHMQPWMIAAAISIPVCEVRAKNGGARVLDAVIGERARQQGKRLVGLETVREQFIAVASIPREFHLAALEESLKLADLTDSMMETTKALYLRGDTALMLPLIRAYAPRTYRGKGYAEFQELLIARRNRVMAERAAEYLEGGNAFMAVGALHLPGDEGLVALLRQRGFSVEPVTD